jgi:chromosome segregation ATPase
LKNELSNIESEITDLDGSLRSMDQGLRRMRATLTSERDARNEADRARGKACEELETLQANLLPAEEDSARIAACEEAIAVIPISMGIIVGSIRT